MDFYLNTSKKIPRQKKNLLILIHDDWDDWFTYSTLYNVYYYTEVGKEIILGSIKVGQKNMKKGQKRADLPDYFESLDQDFFSLGQDVSYYEDLNLLNEVLRVEILKGLNDIAYNKSLFIIALKEEVTKISLLRDVSVSSVEGQFRNLARGNATLTPYNFKYHAPVSKEPILDRMVLDFNVKPLSDPPTNIHILIGRNGVGKTFLFNSMISSLLNGNRFSGKYGYFSSKEKEMPENPFANLISISFSAFDETYPIKEEKDKTKKISYTYIGLKERTIVENDIEEGDSLVTTDFIYKTKSPYALTKEFVTSVEGCRKKSKYARWLDALETLESDPIFKENEISQLAKIPNNESFKRIATQIFSRLSSGHKIVLLTITRLIESIEEKSLVLIDEPECHLHPPLLSAFIRALSDLLINRNAIAILGTHSPVVLQEVPKSCVWKLNRFGTISSAERMNIESFGENVGLLTQEVFGLEVTDCGYHRILKTIANETDSYLEAIQQLNNQLGQEGRAILRNLKIENYEKNS